MKCIFKALTEACTKINAIQIRPSHCVATDYHLNQKTETQRKLNLPLSVLPWVSTAYERLNKMKAIQKIFFPSMFMVLMFKKSILICINHICLLYCEMDVLLVLWSKTNKSSKASSSLKWNLINDLDHTS